MPDHDELRTSAEKSTSTHFDDSTHPLTALRAATKLGSSLSAPAQGQTGQWGVSDRGKLAQLLAATMDSGRCRASTRSAHNRTQRYFVSSTLTNGSIRSPRTAHRPDAWDRPGKRRVPSRCAHTVLETTDETGRGHVEQPGLHAAGRASRCWGAMSGRLRINPGPPHQQNTSPLHGVAMAPARGHIIATCGPYSPKAAPSPRLSSHPPLQSVRREIQKLLCTNFLAPGDLFAE